MRRTSSAIKNVYTCEKCIQRYVCGQCGWMDLKGNKRQCVPYYDDDDCSDEARKRRREKEEKTKTGGER